MEAVVKWFNNEKGYGFINYTKTDDIFVHYSALLQSGYKTLSQGDVVEFNLIHTIKGYQARDVILKTADIIKKNVTKENIEIAAAITTIASFGLGLVPTDSAITNNEININCNNCDIQIIEEAGKEKRVIINVGEK